METQCVQCKEEFNSSKVVLIIWLQNRNENTSSIRIWSFVIFPSNIFSYFLRYEKNKMFHSKPLSGNSRKRTALVRPFVLIVSGHRRLRVKQSRSYTSSSAEIELKCLKVWWNWTLISEDWKNYYQHLSLIKNWEFGRVLPRCRLPPIWPSKIRQKNLQQAPRGN